MVFGPAASNFDLGHLSAIYDEELGAVVNTPPQDELQFDANVGSALQWLPQGKMIWDTILNCILIWW